MKTSLTTLLVLIVPNWTKEFHVHTNASNYAIRTMLAQNPSDTIDKPIYYASRLMIGAETNYSTIKKEAIAMIYDIKKFHHYLLGNSFTFFVDHQALIYLVNKPNVIGWIAQWLLLLKECNFKVIYKLGKVHFVPNQLLGVKNVEPTISVGINYLILFFYY
jgi:hypothetical protein